MGVQYGVNLVTQHNRWDNVFQELKGKATFEICAFGVCKELIVPITAKDIIEWATKINDLANSIGRDKDISIGRGLLPTVTDGIVFVPAHSGDMVQEPVLYVADGDVSEPDPYVYVPAEPMDTLGP